MHEGVDRAAQQQVDLALVFVDIPIMLDITVYGRGYIVKLLELIDNQVKWCLFRKFHQIPGKVGKPMDIPQNGNT